MASVWQQFFKRYYKWSFEDWRRELAEDFKLIRMVNDRNSRCIIRLMRGLSHEQRLKAVQSLIRNVNQYALPMIQENIQKEDIQFKDFYSNALRLYDEEESLRTSYENIEHSATKPFDRKKLQKVIIDTLEADLGEPSPLIKGSEFSYKTTIGPWTVLTDIDTGGRFHQLTYEQRITDAEGKLFFGGVSLFKWLGISGQTMWQYLGDDDIESIAGSFRIILQQFLTATPRLLDGLSPYNFIDYRLLRQQLYEQYKNGIQFNI